MSVFGRAEIWPQLLPGYLVNPLASGVDLPDNICHPSLRNRLWREKDCSWAALDESLGREGKASVLHVFFQDIQHKCLSGIVIVVERSVEHQHLWVGQQCPGQAKLDLLCITQPILPREVFVQLHALALV